MKKHGQEQLSVFVTIGTKDSLYAMGKRIARVTHCNDLSASQVARMALQRGMDALEREYPLGGTHGKQHVHDGL